jgi:hypothetical protein
MTILLIACAAHGSMTTYSEVSFLGAGVKADSSLTTPKLKTALGAPCTQNDSHDSHHSLAASQPSRGSSRWRVTAYWEVTRIGGKGLNFLRHD